MSELENILRESYFVLDFELSEYKEEYRSDIGKHLVTFVLDCPCGGREFEGYSFSEENFVKLADEILSKTASKEHLKRDVEQGLLPPSALEFNTYTGKLFKVEEGEVVQIQ